METKRPPRVSDPETSRAVSQIYDDLNAIADAIGTGQGRTHREGSSTEGEVGDIKIGRARLGKYAVMAKTEDGWVESDELPFRDERKKKGSSSGGTGDGITESSLGAKGYVKFRNGFTIQWGYFTSTIDGSQAFTYTSVGARSFDNNTFIVTYDVGGRTLAKSRSGFTFNRLDEYDDDVTVYFIAIGY